MAGGLGFEPRLAESEADVASIKSITSLPVNCLTTYGNIKRFGILSNIQKSCPYCEPSRFLVRFQTPALRARAAAVMPMRTPANALRLARITRTAMLTARTAGIPLLIAIGKTAAATTEPGNASNIRRTRVVSGTCAINQNPPTRIRNVVIAMTTIAANPRSASLIEDTSRDAASYDPGHYEPPTWQQLSRQHRDSPRDEPG